MTEVERGGGGTDYYAVILVHFVRSSHRKRSPAQFTNFIGKRRPSEGSNNLAEIQPLGRKQDTANKSYIRKNARKSACKIYGDWDADAADNVRYCLVRIFLSPFSACMQIILTLQI